MLSNDLGASILHGAHPLLKFNWPNVGLKKLGNSLAIDSVNAKALLIMPEITVATKAMRTTEDDFACCSVRGDRHVVHPRHKRHTNNTIQNNKRHQHAMQPSTLQDNPERAFKHVARNMGLHVQSIRHVAEMSE